MSKIFYDRSGKAHVMGSGKGRPDGKSENDRKLDRKKDEPRDDRRGKKNDRRDPHSRGAKKDAAPAESSAKGKFESHGQGRVQPAAKKPWGRDRDEERSSRGGRGGNSERGGRGSHGGKSERGGKREFSRDGGRGGRNERGGRGGRGHDRGGRGGRGHSRDEMRRKPLPQATPNPDWIKLKGIVDKNKKGTAFLVFDRRDLEDVFIPRYYTDQLFHGDRVEVYVSDEGEIEDLKVVAHRFKEIFGRIQLRTSKSQRYGVLVYERKKAKEEVYVESVPIEVKEGDWVKAEMIFNEDGSSQAKIMERIGPDLPASYDIQMVAGEFNLTEHHTFDAVKQAESYKLEVPGKDEEGRTDLRHLPFMTIDGERARDFDDAVFVENLGGDGFRLWVAIADVSHYVKEETALDREAYARATSIYFPERAFHMLPRALSEELCSLKPNVPRLSMACSVDYSRDGEKGEIKVYNAIIESRRRATYTEIEAEKADPKHKDLFALYRILKEKRHSRGSIDFDFPEAEIILDEKTGEPSDIVVRPRNDAHRLIEEFMIVANESVTEWMLERKLPFIYRIHEEPSNEAMEKFRKLAKNMGVAIAAKGGVPRPKILAEFIKTLKEHPAEPVLATALLRSMRQAIYSATYGEHYGLASDGYTHFTSPIRRYPDLIVHRLLRAALANESDLEGQEKLEEMAEHCSYRERIASEAERESIRFKQVRLMAKHIGEEFEGKVNGLTEKGMFILLDHPHCEGMVTVDSIGDDFYEFNEERMILAGRKKKRTFTIGMRVKIQVVRVDLDARRVEFELR